MFLNVMAKIGKAIYDRGILPNDTIWLGHNYIFPTYVLVINLKGKLIRVEDLALEKKKKAIAAPLGCYEGIWSDASNKFKACPYLIHDRMGILCPNSKEYVAARERYLNKMHEVSQYVNDKRVNAALKFAMNADLRKVAEREGMDLRLDDFFCISVIVNRKKENLWEDGGLKQRMAEFFFQQLKECKKEEGFCEVTGWEASYFITKHSQLISGYRARAVTMRTYNEEYGGDMDDFVVTRIGAESAAYYNFAILYLETKTYYARMEEIRYLETLEKSVNHKQFQNDRIVYFGTIDGEVLLPVMQNSGWMATYVKTKYKVPYADFADFLRGKAVTTPFCLVEYGVLDKRLVAYNAAIYSRRESLKMIENVLFWIRACQTHDRDYGGLDVCKLLYGNNDLQCRCFFAQNILLGRWGDLAEIMLPACHQDANLYYAVMKLLRMGGFDMQRIMDEPDYLIGCLFAYAVLIERKHSYLVDADKKKREDAQWQDEKVGEKSKDKGDEYEKRRLERIKSMMTLYFQDPLETWKTIRVEIERLTQVEPNKYHELLYNISALEERLGVEDGWYMFRRDEGAMLMGYDCTVKKYYDEIKQMANGGMENEELCDTAVV